MSNKGGILNGVVGAASHAAKNAANKKQRHEMAPLQKPGSVAAASYAAWDRHHVQEYAKAPCDGAATKTKERGTEGLDPRLLMSRMTGRKKARMTDGGGQG